MDRERAVQPPQRRRPALLGMLVAACALSACVSARPWRPCGPPCSGRQLDYAGVALVDTRDQTRVLLEDPTAGNDQHGTFLAGLASIGGKALGTVKIYDEVICAVHTRRVEVSRLAANVVLVPLAVAATVALDYYGADVFDWDLPTEPLPPGCAPGARRPQSDRGGP